MSGQRHLIECHCVLPLYKHKQNPVYHKFAVYSLINDKTGKVIPKYVNCNNCGVTHFVDEFCKSQIKLGKEDIKSIRSIKDIAMSIPDKVLKILEEYNSTVDIYEEVEHVIDNLEFPRNIVIKREIIEDNYHLKILQILSGIKFKIISEVVDNTIFGGEKWVIQLN